MAEQKNPFGVGSPGESAFKAAYQRLKTEAEGRKQGIGQDYADMYQQLRGQSYSQGLGASAQRGLSGGQAAGVRGAISAQQMGQLGSLMQGQERAVREAKIGEGAIYSNALLEGQQAQEMENVRLARIAAILNKPDGTPRNFKTLTDIERQQLAALGYVIPSTQSGVRSPEQQQISQTATSGFSAVPGSPAPFLNPNALDAFNVGNWINPFTGRPFSEGNPQGNTNTTSATSPTLPPGFVPPVRGRRR
jgi:hypothetical protein